MIADPSRNAAIVAIGRNEGERLKRCLHAAVASAPTVVYVDSGSMDESVALAASLGCHVVPVDREKPYSAARARNEGFACLMDIAPEVSFVQFVDGDCVLEAGWLERGLAELEARGELGVVRGHLCEINPRASIFNLLCDMEWRQTPGEMMASGGIFLVRVEAFRGAGGFRPEVIAAEDDEFCVRLRRLGWKILMVDAPMARHDAALMHFSQWWRRTQRAGHAFAQVGALFDGTEECYFVRDRRRVWMWGLALPLLGLALAPFTHGLSLLGLLGLYLLQLAHIYRGCRRRGWVGNEAWIYAFFAVISRPPALQGMIGYHWRRWRGQAPVIIEHKRSA